MAQPKNQIGMLISPLKTLKERLKRWGNRIGIEPAALKPCVLQISIKSSGFLKTNSYF